MTDTVNFVIGIGGSGAKSLEALVHLCACGLGPKRLRLAIIDPDEANGNVRRTRVTIAAYRLARVRLDRGITGQSARASGCGFLRTDIEFDDKPTWSPLPTKDTDLRKLFNFESMSPDAQGLMDALYLEREEQQMPLREGFRGRPNVGAAALAALPADVDSFWPDLLNVIALAQENTEVWLFLVGSVFGGTGASGFPVVARMVRRHVAQAGLQRVRLSGAMLLPYFTFQPPDEGSEVVSADPRLFVAKAQQSLVYYQGLMDEGTFDDLYVVGWPRMIRLQGDPQHGGNEQCNPPMLPELYAAFAAADVFAQPAGPSDERADRRGDAERMGGIHYIAVGRGDRLTWDDLPPVNGNGAGLSAKAALGGGLRFAYAYTQVYHELLRRENISRVFRHAFWRSHLRDVGMEDDLEQAANDAVARYCEWMLRYFLTITDDSLAGGFEVRMFEKIGLVTGDMAGGLLQLKARASDADLRGFRELVIDGRGQDLTRILKALSERPQSGAEMGKGLGRFVSALHRQCAVAE